VDVSDREGMFSAVAGLPDEFSQTEVLVNNAGLANTVSDTAGGNVDDWEQMIDVNCKGLMYDEGERERGREGERERGREGDQERHLPWWCVYSVQVLYVGG
jgi:NAD(P)-dependent dehydrogenase (short-subunit alcohol dehydrogenase family)